MSQTGATVIAVMMNRSNGKSEEKIHPTLRKYASAYDPIKRIRSLMSQMAREIR